MPRIRCQGGPLDGRTVAVDGKGRQVSRSRFWLAEVNGRALHADRPDSLDAVADQSDRGGPGWTEYVRADDQPPAGLPLYRAC